MPLGPTDDLAPRLARLAARLSCPWAACPLGASKSQRKLQNSLERNYVLRNLRLACAPRAPQLGPFQSWDSILLAAASEWMPLGACIIALFFLESMRFALRDNRSVPPFVVCGPASSNVALTDVRLLVFLEVVFCASCGAWDVTFPSAVTIL